jgi:hypothetical protein
MLGRGVRVADVLNSVCLSEVTVMVGRVLVTINRVEGYIRIRDGLRVREFRKHVDPKYEAHVKAAIKIANIACRK